MNISIKNKFAVITIIMSILSLIFAYIISDEFISRNLDEKESLKQKEKVTHIEKEFNNLESGILADLELVVKTHKVQEFFLLFNEKPKVINFARWEDVETELKYDFNKNFNFLESLSFIFIDRNGNFLDSKNSKIYKLDSLKETFKENSKSYVDFKYYYNNDGLNYYVMVPVYGEDGIFLGTLILKSTLGMNLLYRLSSEHGVDFIFFNEDKITVNTFGEGIEKGFFRNENLEYKNKNYKLLPVKIDKTAGKMYVVYNRNKSIIEKRELSIYLFITLFFIFTLLFIFGNTTMNFFVDTLRDLTLKINSLKNGNLDVDLGNLKNSNDEIGLLAYDFEMMVHILKGKIRELEEANSSNKEYLEQLELVNRDLKESQKSISEKSQNIDKINKLLNSRISEISNMYYLMVNISKYMIDDKLYDIIIKGMREGLIIGKVALYIYQNDKMILKRKFGFENLIEILEIEGVDNFLLKKDVIQAEEIIQEKGINVSDSYIFSLISEGELYGMILVSNGQIITQEFKKTILTYIKIIIMTLENRKLYLKLIEDNKKLEETTKELQESEKLKNIFLSNVSHELRVPLVPIKGYHEIILEEHMGELNPKQRKALRTSLKNVERLQEIIENILNYSRIESGKYQIFNTRIKVEDVMEEALLRLENLSGKEVILNKKYTKKGAFIMMDKEALKQIFVNIISNSLKFSKLDLVTIDIKIEEEEKKYRVTLKDNGLGMDKNKIEFLIKSFRQLDEGDTRKYSGVGLGLTVAEKILNYYGEKIYINSSLNKGTEVYFYLRKGEDN
jgi:signal transduction histidine kinase